MFLRQMLFGPKIAYAPEDDRGAAEEDIDLGLEDDPPEDDEPEDEEDVEEDPDDADDTGGEQVDQSRPSRGDRRVADATKATKEARERAEAADRRAEALEQQIRANAQPRETQEQFDARLAAMDPWDRTEYLRQLDAQRTQNELAQIRFDSWDRGDKAAYESLAAREPIAAKLKDDVERLVMERRKAGQNVDRETVLKFLIGERALANKGRATGKAQRTATANRDRQTARPANGRADATAGDRRGGNEKSARAKRLAEMEI